MPSTFHAAMWLLSCMKILVDFQVPNLAQLLPTYNAAVWWFFCSEVVLAVFSPSKDPVSTCWLLQTRKHMPRQLGLIWVDTTKCMKSALNCGICIWAKLRWEKLELKSTCPLRCSGAPAIVQILTCRSFVRIGFASHCYYSSPVVLTLVWSSDQDRV